MFQYSYNTGKFYKHKNDSAVRTMKATAKIMVITTVKNTGITNVLNNEKTSAKKRSSKMP